jgi:hypothetical protein
MLTLERTLQAPLYPVAAARHLEGIDAVSVDDNHNIGVWKVQQGWIRVALASPVEKEEADATERTILGTDEVSLERVSLSHGNVTLNLSDEQAERVLSRYR